VCARERERERKRGGERESITSSVEGALTLSTNEIPKNPKKYTKQPDQRNMAGYKI
jgi:hypothetical protein